MNYIDVYKRRISHLGSDYQEHAYKSGILEFRRYLKYNQHTEHNLALDGEDVCFSGVILTDKEDENRVSQILLTKVVEDGGPTLKQGDLLWWGEDKQPWLLYRQTTSSYQPHQKFYMVRCNYEIKWLDAEGMLHSSWVYLLGSKDSKIKDNFRTWHSVITPQPNKYINIMMPHQLMPLGTEIMVIDEVWTLVEYDQSSVPGIVYMSFTETNLNEQRDSLEDKLANADKLAQWEVSMADTRTVVLGEEFDLGFNILKNGIVQEVVPEIILDGELMLLENNQIKALGAGTVTVNYKGFKKSQQIIIGNEPQLDMILVGDSKIRVASTNIYVLENAIDTVTYSIEDPQTLVKMRVEGNTCTIIANEKNKLGSFKLTATCGDQTFTKNISVVSLWQVI